MAGRLGQVNGGGGDLGDSSLEAWAEEEVGGKGTLKEGAKVRCWEDLGEKMGKKDTETGTERRREAVGSVCSGHGPGLQGHIFHEVLRSHLLPRASHHSSSLPRPSVMLHYLGPLWLQVIKPA